VEQVNSIVSELIKADILEDKDTTMSYDDKLEEMEQLYLFKPESGNVCFSSAYDCWSFNLPGFIPNVAKKLGMNPKALLKFMWEQYYYIPSTKTITKNPPSSNSKVLFVSLIMDPLVERYNKFFTAEVLLSTAQIKDAHASVKEAFSKLLPMEHGILKMVVDHLPCPLEAQKNRLRIFCPFLAQAELPEKYTHIKASIEACKSDLFMK
jgi:ribosome assembly protein 1